MEIKAIVAIALIISAFLLAAKLSPEIGKGQFKEGTYIHIDNIKIAFYKTDANVDMEYSLSPFAKAYIFLFGSKNLELKIREILAEFNITKIQKVGLDNASITLTNVSELNGQYYLHDSRRFGISPDILTISFPDGNSRIYKNPASTPDLFYTQWNNLISFFTCIDLWIRNMDYSQAQY